MWSWVAVVDISTAYAMELHHIPTWIKENEPSFVPPVCNKMMHNDGFWQVMFVGGPNIRKDYHIQQGEELFYQIRGDMCLKIVEHGKFKDVPIKEGEIFLLPSRFPHSPQRFQDTVGLVMERKRALAERDGLRWYTDDGRVLYEEWFHCTNLGTQLVPVIKRFSESEESRTGEPTKEYPPAPFELDSETSVAAPINLANTVAERDAEIERDGSVLLFSGQNPHFQVRVCGAGNESYIVPTTEVFFHQLKGSSTLYYRKVDGSNTDDNSTDGATALELAEGAGFLLEEGYAYQTRRSSGSRCLEIFASK